MNKDEFRPGEWVMCIDPPSEGGLKRNALYQIAPPLPSDHENFLYLNIIQNGEIRRLGGLFPHRFRTVGFNMPTPAWSLDDLELAQDLMEELNGKP